ncbi:MAG TPA: GNAT family N-acetyltransferase [Ktedonobacteraceae bacterium]|nr:GNAT family N-acetyltransferase [Ktedonobacteraceae bacterium]
MPFDDLELLRLHIEAVWDVNLPKSTENDVDILANGKQPPWLLYVGQLAQERVFIWRPDVNDADRRVLQARVDKAFILTTEEAQAQGIEREVALKFTGQPTMNLVRAQQIARPIAVHEQALVEAFEPGAAAYYLEPERRPLYGVSVEGRLLSIAHSARRTAKACELGVDTLPEARRRGYALAVTILWTADVIQEGCIPFYSALAENASSLALAHAAGYCVFARGISLTRI